MKYKTLLLLLTGIILTGCSSLDRNFETPWNKAKNDVLHVPEGSCLNESFEFAPIINSKPAEKGVDDNDMEKIEPEMIKPEEKRKEPSGYRDGETAIVKL